MTALFGPAAAGEIVLGKRYDTFTITITGTATSGDITIGYRKLWATTFNYNATTSTVATAIQAMTGFEAVTVSGSAGAWVVNCKLMNKSVPELPHVVHTLSPSSCDVTITGTESPMLWAVQGDVGVATIEQTAGKTIIPGQSTERSTQTQVSEYVIENLFGGLGRRDYLEAESVSRFWDGDLMTFVDRQITLGPLLQTPTFSTAFTQFNNPLGVYSDGTYAYVSDTFNYKIRKVTLADGTAVDLAGDGTQGHADGTGASARFYNPRGITFDGTDLYVVDGSCIRKVTTAGVVTTLCGAFDTTGNVNSSTAADVRFNNPICITNDGTSLYVGDRLNDHIRKVTIATGATTNCGLEVGVAYALTYVSSNSLLYFVDGGNDLYSQRTDGSDRTFLLSFSTSAYGMTSDDTSDLFVMVGNYLRQIDVTFLTDNGIAGDYTRAGAVDGTGASALFSTPGGLSYTSGIIHAADTGNHLIRRIVAGTGSVTTVAGTAGISGSTNGTGVVGTELMVHAGHVLHATNGTYIPVMAQQGTDTLRLSYWDTSNTYWKQARSGTITDGAVRDLCVYKGVVYVPFGTDSSPKYAAWVPDTDYSLIATSLSYAVKAMCVWDGKLYRIDGDGKIYFTVGNSTFATSGRTYAGANDWTQLDGMQVYPTAEVISIRPGRLPSGQSVLYIMTADSFYSLDPEAGAPQLVTTILGNTSTSIAINGGNALSYRNGQTAVILNNSVHLFDGSSFSNIGPFNDQGLPTGSFVFKEQMYCRSLTATNYWLLVAMSNRDDTAGAVLGYNGEGWHDVVPYQNGLGCRAALVTAVTSPRLYTIYGHYIDFNDAAGNPLFWSGQNYAASGDLVLSWFDRGLSDVTKTMYWLRLRVRQISADETITAYYQINSVADVSTTTTSSAVSNPRMGWKQMLDSTGAAATVNSAYLGGNSAGVAELYFDRAALSNGDDYSEGTENYNVRIWLHFARGSTTTNTPVLESGVVSFDAEFDHFKGFTFTLDLKDVGPDGRTALRQWTDLQELANQKRLTPFAFVADELHWVSVHTLQGQLATVNPVGIMRVGVNERLLT